MLQSLFKNNINGLLGTLTFHLLLAILLMGINLSSVQSKIDRHVILLDFDDKKFDLTQKLLQEQAVKEKFLEKMAAAELSKRSMDIPVNMAEKIEQELAADKYLNQLKHEMGIRDPVEELPTDDLVVEQKKEESKATYKGPTTITFELINRKDRYLHIPVYLCESSGKVTVDIRVDQEGVVIAASINTAKSDVSSECLFNAALRSAYKSRFNSDLNAPLKQEGYISYTFKSQY